MKFDREVIESLIAKSRIDHSGKNIYGCCPYCGEDEFGISLEENHLFRCFRGKHCGQTGNIFTLLKHLGKMELVKDKSFYRETDIFSKLEKRSLTKSRESLDLTLPDISSPIGWRRIDSHPYLLTRGFTSSQFTKYEIGTTSILKKYKDYVIFLIRQDGFIKGYVSRSILSKSEIDSKNRAIKEWNRNNPSQTKTPILRYSNSLDTDFSKILYGIDEVVPRVTSTVIIVEGLLDKINLEIIAPELFLDKEVVVCCTWGKKISEYQIAKLKEKLISRVILLYDPDAINDSKKYSLELTKHIRDVQVGFLEEKDPGDLSQDEFYSVLLNLQDPYKFNLEKLQKRQF